MENISWTFLGADTVLNHVQIIFLEARKSLECLFTVVGYGVIDAAVDAFLKFITIANSMR